MIDTSIMPRRLLKRHAVLDRVSMSTAKLYQLMNQGKFPRPVRLAGAGVAWLESDVDGWIADRVAERDAERRAA